ncbi:MAG: hypothetical protein ABH865_02900 [Candidatus Omnitrophota bacterium]
MKNFLITSCGIYIVLLGLVLCGILGLSFLLLDEHSATLPMNYSPSFLVVAYLPFIIWLITTGIALLMRKNWARYSLFIMSFFALFLGLVVAITFLLFPSPTKITLGLRLFFYTLIFIFLVVIPVFFISFFNQKTVKGIFKSHRSAHASGQKPFGIILVSIVMFTSGIISFFYGLFSIYPQVPVFGNITLTGIPLKAYFYALASVNILIAIGLMRMRRVAWVGCIIYNSFIAIAGIVNIFFISEETVLDTLPQIAEVPSETLMTYYRIYSVMGLIVPVIILIYIISRKKAFQKLNFQSMYNKIPS